MLILPFNNVILLQCFWNSALILALERKTELQFELLLILKCYITSSKHACEMWISFTKTLQNYIFISATFAPKCLSHLYIQIWQWCVSEASSPWCLLVRKHICGFCGISQWPQEMELNRPQATTDSLSPHYKKQPFSCIEKLWLQSLTNESFKSNKKNKIMDLSPGEHLAPTPKHCTTFWYYGKNCIMIRSWEFTPEGA